MTKKLQSFFSEILSSTLLAYKTFFSGLACAAVGLITIFWIDLSEKDSVAAELVTLLSLGMLCLGLIIALSCYLILLWQRISK